MTVSITLDLTELYDAESTSNWNDASTYSGFQREGNYCLGNQVSQGSGHFYKSITSTNLSNTHIYSWMMLWGNPETEANGGFRIVVGDGTNRIAYHVGGSDNYGFQVGAWSCFVLNTASPPSNYTTLAGSESSLSWSAITEVGVGFNATNKAIGNVDNCFWDICRYGNGLIIKGGTSGDPGTFAEIATDDASTASGKAYGIVRELQSGVYGVQGRLTFGDSSGTSSTYFKDTDAVIIFEDRAVSSSLYQFNVVGNSTGTNSFVLGNKLGSGDDALGSNGCTIQSAGPNVSVNFNGSNVDTCNIYGCKFLNIAGGITLSTDTSHEFIGNTVDQSGQVVANQMIIRNCTFSATTDSNNDGSALLWNGSINIKNCIFNANTDATNDPHAIEHPDSGTFTYDNLTFSGNDYDIEFSASSGTLTINTTNGSNPGTYEITGGGSSVTIVNTVYLTVYVKDENLNNIENAQVAIYKSSDDTQLMNEQTDENGMAQETYNYVGDTSIYYRVRKSSSGGTRYVPFSSYGTITSDGFTVTVILYEDNVAV
ncbi:MAG: hypothetical protein DRP09_15695 [Candidatus Thorarchaeota archaeon]|nr:MAG: hypothetical protein DRP09_15695 [Candidatus Thorarchaeota archaeon]